MAEKQRRVKLEFNPSDPVDRGILDELDRTSERGRSALVLYYATIGFVLARRDAESIAGKSDSEALELLEYDRDRMALAYAWLKHEQQSRDDAHAAGPEGIKSPQPESTPVAQVASPEQPEVQAVTPAAPSLRAKTNWGALTIAGVKGDVTPEEGQP